MADAALSLLVSGLAAVLLGLVTVRCPATICRSAPSPGAQPVFYLFSKLEFLGRNDGISSVPPLSIGSLKMMSAGTIYYVIWAGVIIAGLLTLNLLELAHGRAIRALRRGHIR